MRIDVITLFPEEFRVLVSLGVTGRAIEQEDVVLKTWNPRDFATNGHNSVDDRPYGGGPGMVMTVEPLRQTIQAARQDGAEGSRTKVSLLSPQGGVLNQSSVAKLAQRDRLILLCGRYEGIDERLIQLEVDEEWSIGDYVLSGGELAAAVIVDSVLRLQPGVLGHEQSAQQDSFSQGLLDCPHYSRPENVGDLQVPQVLLSGNHGAIARWRRMQALGRTWLRRPELLDEQSLSDEDRQLLNEYRQSGKAAGD